MKTAESQLQGQPISTERKILLVLATLSTISLLFNLTIFFVKHKLPCSICFDYPSWWSIVYPIKDILELASFVLIFFWKRVGIYILTAVILVNAVSILIFEYEIFFCVGNLLSLFILYLLTKRDWSRYL